MLRISVTLESLPSPAGIARIIARMMQMIELTTVSTVPETRSGNLISSVLSTISMTDLLPSPLLRRQAGRLQLCSRHFAPAGALPPREQGGRDVGKAAQHDQDGQHDHQRQRYCRKQLPDIPQQRAG